MSISARVWCHYYTIIDDDDIELQPRVYHIRT